MAIGSVGRSTLYRIAKSVQDQKQRDLTLQREEILSDPANAETVRALVELIQSTTLASAKEGNFSCVIAFPTKHKNLLDALLPLRFEQDLTPRFTLGTNLNMQEINYVFHWELE